MKHLIFAAIMGAGVLTSGSAFAASTPSGLSTDGRIKVVNYNANDVVSLRGFYGYQTTVSFAPTEKIQNISIGDSIAWQVVPNKVGNILFIKPVEEDASTNMTVITDRRIYNFELTSGMAGSPRDSKITYMLKFAYPNESIMDFTNAEVEIFKSSTPDRPYAPASKIENGRISSAGAPRDLNFEYSFKGDDEIAPSTVFDNGEFTYFKFRDMNDIPAIFEVDKDRNESVINYHIEEGYVVVNSMSPQFTLRHGGEEACVFNDNFNDTVPLFAKREAE